MFKVEVVQIDDILDHPNADRLELAQIRGWQTVIAKNYLKKGDLAIYIPIDSILPIEVESKIFGASSKIKLHKSRVRTIKIRGAISQGMVVKPEVLGLQSKSLECGMDLTEVLRIQKYEPPDRSNSMFQGAAAGSRKIGHNPNFHKYGGIENFKNYPDLFQEGEKVWITEKIHGTHFRCGWVPYYASTLWQKIKQKLGFAPTYQFVFGSNNVQLQNKLLYKGYYENNVYAKIVKQYKLKEILGLGEVLHGEIYGDGIQKNYSYGCKQGEHRLVVFDLRFQIFGIEGKGPFMSFSGLRSWCKDKGLESVPLLYVGSYDPKKIKSFTVGPSVLCPSQPVREGIVIKPLVETNTFMGRKCLKLISEDYLLDKSNTDFH